MIHKFTSVLVGFAIAMMLSAPLVPLPQQAIIIKHRGGGSGPATFVSPAIENFDNSSVGTLSTAPTVIPAGSLAVVACRTGNNIGFPIVVTSSPSATWTPGGIAQASLGTLQQSIATGLTGGSTTFTCNYSPTGPFNSIEVLIFTPGGVTGTIVTHNQNISSATSNLPTAPAITTTGPGILVLCQSNSDSPAATAGVIGADSASYPGTNGNTGCEYTLPTGAQTSITGTVHLSTSQDWITNIIDVQ
jgi:hypothetical protein